MTSLETHDWVFGFYPTEERVRAVIQKVLGRGIQTDQIAILAPRSFREKSISGVAIECRHPQRAWIFRGAFWGAVMSALVGWIVSGDMADNVIRPLPGVLVAILGAFLGIGVASFLHRGDDALLAYYKKLGAKNYFLMGIRCETGNSEEMRLAEGLIRDSGALLSEIPAISTPLQPLIYNNYTTYKGS